MSEKLEKVERFEQIACGDRLVVHGCTFGIGCHGKHEGMALVIMRNSIAQGGQGPRGATWGIVPIAWDVVPSIHGFQHWIVSPRDVEAGRVFRWVEHDDKSETATRERELERVE